ncbi:putative sun domain protein [Neofusicoccum parvum]|nr:putative sun domain protein [Neofusicoccum parvum]
MAASVETAAAGLPQSRRDDMRTGFATVGTLSQGSARTSVQKSLKCEGTSIDEAVQVVQTSTVTATVCDLNGQIISQEECDEGIATGRFVEDDGEPAAVDASYRLIRQLTTATTHLHKGRTFAPPKREATAYWVTAYAY